MHYASIASSERIPLLQDALSVLNKALSPECQQELQKQAPTARMQFEQERERIVKYLQGVELPEHNYTPTFANEYHRMYVSFCSEHQLFLNFCRRCQRCVVANKDIVNISLITNSDDTTTFPGLARVVNEIKERYATARLLLFEGYKPAFDLLPYDEITNYIDNLDYAIYGIRPSKIKMAFESAYSVLDKIAIFINRYIPLGVKEEGVGFSKHSFWKEQQRLKSAMRNLRNYYLYALYDIHRDLEKDGFLERLRKMRNVSTHRYIVTHIERIHQVLPDESPENHIDHIDLFNSTLELLKLVRSAIVYLIAFIQMEEQRRHPPSLDRKEIPIIAPEYRHDIFSRYEF
jgi:hypothetical protein